MSIIITGLKMSTERESFNLTIKYNGTVLDTETGCQVAEAHELPPHGRLIDADAFAEALMNDSTHDVWGAYASQMILLKISAAPTIILAEEGET